MIEDIIEKLENILVSDEYNDILTEFSTMDVELKHLVEDDVISYDFDLDKNQRDVCYFILPDNTTFNTMDLSTEDMTNQIVILMVFRNDLKAILYKKALRNTKCLYQLLKQNNTLDGLIGDIKITDMEYYHAIEGNVNIKGAEIILNIETEV